MIRTLAFWTRLAVLATLAMSTTGCTTTAKDLLGLEKSEEIAAASEPSQTVGKSDKPYVDPMVAQAGGGDTIMTESEAGMTASPSMPGDPSRVGEVVMEPTGVSAGQASIFSTQGAVAAESGPMARETPASLVPSGVPQHGYNAAVASLFSAPQPAEPPLYGTDETVAVE